VVFTDVGYGRYLKRALDLSGRKISRMGIVLEIGI
jgi:hypothetical protein